MQIIIPYLIMALGIIIAISLHEFSKALASHCLGDKTIKNKKQLTFNIFKYIDPIGFIIMFFFGYGFGKPVETNSVYYKNKKAGVFIVYLVPIIVNIVFAILFYNLTFIWYGFYFIANLNLSLAIFNFIPIYPLDGEKLLKNMLKPNNSIKYIQYENTIRILIFLLLVMGYLGKFLDVILDFLENLINAYLVFVK